MGTSNSLDRNDLCGVYTKRIYIKYVRVSYYLTFIDTDSTTDCNPGSID